MLGCTNETIECLDCTQCQTQVRKFIPDYDNQRIKAQKLLLQLGDEKSYGNH